MSAEPDAMIEGEVTSGDGVACVLASASETDELSEEEAASSEDDVRIPDGSRSIDPEAIRGAEVI